MLFEDCVFDGARIRFIPAADTEFRHCSFRNVILSHWQPSRFALVGCTFTGRLRDWACSVVCVSLR